MNLDILDQLILVLSGGLFGGLVKGLYLMSKSTTDKTEKYSKDGALFFDVLTQIALAPVAALLIWGATLIASNAVGLILISVFLGFGSRDVLRSQYRSTVPDSADHEVSATERERDVAYTQAGEALAKTRGDLSTMISYMGVMFEENKGLKAEKGKLITDLENCQSRLKQASQKEK